MKTKTLPEDWKEVELSEVCKIVSGSTPSTARPEFWDGYINWITPAEISEGHNWYYSDTQRKITNEGLKSCSSELFPKGTVMLTTRAPIGKVAIAGTEMCSNQGFKNFVCDEKRLNPEFLYFWLRANKKNLQNLGRGATFTEISKTIVSKIKIPLPPLPVQKAIVSVLEKAEKLKQQRAEADKLTQEYLQSVFYEMFMRKEFEKIKIEEGILKTENKSPEKEFPEKPFNYIDIASIDNISKKIIETKEILGRDAPSRAKQEVHKKDVIVSTVRPNLNAVSIVPEELNGQICSTGFCILRADNKKFISEYLYFISQAKFFVKDLVNKCKGANYPAVSNRDIHSMQIPLPPISLQNKFTAIVEKVEAMREQQKKAKVEIDNLFNSLMQRAFKGELVR